jgi:hypothetical protein
LRFVGWCDIRTSEDTLRGNLLMWHERSGDLALRPVPCETHGCYSTFGWCYSFVVFILLRTKSSTSSSMYTSQPATNYRYHSMYTSQPATNYHSNKLSQVVGSCHLHTMSMRLIYFRHKCKLCIWFLSNNRSDATFGGLIVISAGKLYKIFHYNRYDMSLI